MSLSSLQPVRTARRVATARVAGLLFFGAVGAIVACRNHDDPCIPVAPGVYVYSPGISLYVRDAAGRGQAFGDTAITYRGSDSVISTGRDTLRVEAGFGAPGTFAVRVKRRYYRDVVVPSVTVGTGICGGPLVTSVPVSLSLVSGAPAVRSIDVIGASFLYAPGAQIRLAARFDADPSVPTTVTWRLSDTTVARVDAAGLVTAKCTLASGLLDTVTAIATVDTTLRSRATFGVAPQSSCP